jgi:hypothetical protein
LKRRHWFRLQLRRPTVDWTTSIPQLREQIERSASMFGELPAGIEVSPVIADGLSAEWLLSS